MSTNMTIVARSQVRLINRPFRLFKRLIDIILCLIVMPLLLPLLLIVAVLIKLDSPGPVLFKQKRIGKGGRPFDIYKLRTMRHNSDISGLKEFMKQYIQGQVPDDGNKDYPVYKPPIQNQITRIGKFLRKTSIDELPQLWNVLAGEMSLVGPRPNVPWEVEAYDSWHNERLEVKPGITGLAQVKGRSGIKFSELVAYDVEYVKNQSVFFDMKIIWWTVIAVLKGTGSG